MLFFLQYIPCEDLGFHGSYFEAKKKTTGGVDWMQNKAQKVSRPRRKPGEMMKKVERELI